MQPVYFDHIAATPLYPEVVEAMLPFLKEHYGNPSSLHSLGKVAKQAIEQAREQVAGLIQADSEEIYFTASGSEANNLAIKGVANARQKKGRHIVTSKIDHYSVLHPLKTLSRQGFEVTYLPVDKQGVLDPAAVEQAIRDDTILVSIMLANSEVGTIQPLAEIGKLTKERGIYLHADAVAAVGRIPVNVNELGVDLLSLAADQFYGPKGSAGLYVRKGTRFLPQIEGGTQEDGKRAGSYNVAGIVGMGQAAQLIARDMPTIKKRLQDLQKKLRSGLENKLSDIIYTGHVSRRLPGHVSLCVKYIEGESMLLFLDMQRIAVASGSACTSLALKTSHVLEAIGVDAATANGSMVISMGRDNTEADVERFLEVFPPIIDRLRQMSPLYKGGGGNG
jgi:cysteine desulfurase